MFQLSEGMLGAINVLERGGGVCCAALVQRVCGVRLIHGRVLRLLL